MNAGRRESLDFLLCQLLENTLPRFTQEFEAHHLVLSLRSCSCAADHIFLFSRLYADKGEQLFVDAVFQNGGGWAPCENDCSANAPTCEVWRGCVVPRSVTVTQQRFMGLGMAANADVAATEEVQLVPCEQTIYVATIGRNRTHLSCVLALQTDLVGMPCTLGCRQRTRLHFRSPCC